MTDDEFDGDELREEAAPTWEQAYTPGDDVEHVAMYRHCRCGNYVKPVEIPPCCEEEDSRCRPIVIRPMLQFTCPKCGHFWEEC